MAHFNLQAQISASTAHWNDYLVHINWHDQRMEQFMLDSHKLLGWGLITLGRTGGLPEHPYEHAGDIVWRWGQAALCFLALLYLMMDQLREVVVCVALIICGAWLVRGPRAESRSRRTMPEDFTEYTAGCAGRKQRALPLPKLSALLGKPVTPDDETEDADDGRDEK